MLKLALNKSMHTFDNEQDINKLCDLKLCTASDIFTILAYSALFFLVYASISNHIQCYWGIFTHIEPLRHILAC